MKARIVWLILCGIWGSTWLFIKIGLNDLPPLTFAGIRFVLASLILSSLVWMRRVRWPRTRDEGALIAISGFLPFSLYYCLGVLGGQHIFFGLSRRLQLNLSLLCFGIAHLY